MNSIVITHVHLETPIVLACDALSTLIVEAPSEFYSMVADLKSEFVGEDGKFVFCKNGKIFSPSSSGELVHNVFDVTLNDKKTVLSLYKKMESNYAKSDSIEAESKLIAAITELFTSLFENVSVPLEYDEPSVLALLKTCSVQPSDTFDDLTEKFICMINLAIVIL